MEPDMNNDLVYSWWRKVFQKLSHKRQDGGLVFIPNMAVRSKRSKCPVVDLRSLAEFDKVVAENQAVVVDFYAAWCGPCRQVGPKYAFWAGQVEYKQIMFAAVNVDLSSEIADRENIKGMPTFKFYFRGQHIATIVGASPDVVSQLEDLKYRVKYFL